MGSEIIEQQEEAQDTIILANSDSSSSFIGIEEELDPITEAIRQEILQKQRNILRKYITENLDLTVNHYDDQEFANYLRNVDNLTTRLKLLGVKKCDNMISKYNNHWRIRCEYLLEE